MEGCCCFIKEVLLFTISNKIKKHYGNNKEYSFHTQLLIRIIVTQFFYHLYPSLLFLTYFFSETQKGLSSSLIPLELSCVELISR